jgi:alpha-galactosidase
VTQSAARRLRIVHVGAASTVFNPRLIADFARSRILAPATLVLIDPDERALEMMARVGQRIVDVSGADLELVATTDHRKALEGASFVITTIGVGGAAAWQADVEIPEQRGIRQTVGDTVGPGGVLRALRQIPVHLDIARAIAEVAPRAWLVDYSNPMTAIVRAVQRETGVSCFGLCHGIHATRDFLAGVLEVPAAELDVMAAGLNHLSWITELRHGGRDMYPRLREGGDVRDRLEPVSRTLMDVYGRYPAPADRHVAEFFGSFLPRDGGPFRHGLDGGREMTDREIRRKDDVRVALGETADGRRPLHASLLDSRREPERGVAVLEAIAGGAPVRELAVNVGNAAYVSGLPGGAVVEVPGVARSGRVDGQAVEALPLGIQELLAARVEQQELTVEAAVSGDRVAAVEALAADPLVRDRATAEAILDEALATQGSRLPQFA